MSLELSGMQEKRNLPQDPESAIHAFGCVELRDDGWEHFQDALTRSDGYLLMLIHPWFHPEIAVIHEYSEILQTQGVLKEYEASYVAAHVDRYMQYAHEISNTAQEYSDAGIPILNYFESPSNDTHGIINRGKTDFFALHDHNISSFNSNGFYPNEPMFYVPTSSFAPYPLSDSSSNASENKARDMISQIQLAGAKSITLGGSFFGGYEFGNKFDRFESYRLDDYDVRIQPNSTQDDLSSFLVFNGCVGETMKFLRDAGILVEIGEGITYPQKMPKPHELSMDGWRVKWESGFEYLRSLPKRYVDR